MTDKDRPEQTDKTSGGYTVTYDPAAAHEAGYKLGFEDGRRTATQEGQEPPDIGQRSYGHGHVDAGWFFPGQTKIDALLPDGTHRYWSTHCRHDRHDDCSATEIVGLHPEERVPTLIERKPAQCKTCSAPCICDCHKRDISDG